MKAPQRLSVISPQQCVLKAEGDENVGQIAQQEHEVRQAEPGQQTVECALHRPGGKRFRGIRGHWPSWVQIRGSFAKLNIYTILIFKLIHSTNSKYILSTFWEFNRQEADNNTMNQPSIEPPLHNGAQLTSWLARQDWQCLPPSPPRQLSGPTFPRSRTSSPDI